MSSIFLSVRAIQVKYNTGTRFPHTFQTKMHLKWTLICLITGIIIRLFLLTNGGWRIDFDEAFNGLLAFDILAGKTVFFTPPEVIGGSGTPYVLALVFSYFGISVYTFRLISLLWSALYILSTGWLAHLAYGQRISILAMGFAALAPPYMQFVGMKLWSSYVETILLGNLLFIGIYYLLRSQSRRYTIGSMVFVGLIAGLMFWLTWLGFYYFVPVGLILLWKGRQQVLRWGWLGLVTFGIGSLPFWLFNIPRGMPTLNKFLSDTPMTPDQIIRVLIDFISIRFPNLVSGHPSWGYQANELAILMAFLYGIGLILTVRKAKSRQPFPVMLAIFVLTVPLIYINSTHSRNALPEFNPWGIDATGRYVLMWHTVLPIGMALLVQHLWQKKRQIGIGLCVIVLAINSIGTLTVDPERGFDSPYYDRLPRDLTSLIDLLDERDITHVWVDGGIGHVLMFLTERRILAEDYRSVFLAGGMVRQPDVLAEIQAASPTVLITPIVAGQQNPPLQQALDRNHVSYDMIRVMPELVVYIIAGNFDPQQVASGLGYQY